MLTRFAGFFVGSVFGLAFVLINSGPPLPPSVSLTARTMAVGVAVAIVVLAVLAMRKEGRENSEKTRGTPGESGKSGEQPGTPRFGAFFGVVTLVEFALIIGGAITISNLPGVPGQAGVAWVALVVGLHFLPLAWHWQQREILVVGGYATALGATGLVMALSGHPDWVPLVSGVVTGAGMLLGSLAALILMRREAAAAGTG